MTTGAQQNLNSCLESITTSNILLESSIQLLRNSTDDFPRLTTVLKHKKMFAAVPEIDILQTSSHMKNTIEPQIYSLTMKIDSELQKLEKRKQALVQKSDLQKIRLDTFNRLNGLEHSGQRSSQGQQQQQQQALRTQLPDGSSNAEDQYEVVGDEKELQRLKFLKSKKQRLNYSLSRFNLQDKKRRLSMLNHQPV